MQAEALLRHHKRTTFGCLHVYIHGVCGVFAKRLKLLNSGLNKIYNSCIALNSSINLLQGRWGKLGGRQPSLVVDGRRVRRREQIHSNLWVYSPPFHFAVSDVWDGSGVGNGVGGTQMRKHVWTRRVALPRGQTGMYPWAGGLEPSPNELIPSPVHLTLKKAITDKAVYGKQDRSERNWYFNLWATFLPLYIKCMCPEHNRFHVPARRNNMHKPHQLLSQKESFHLWFYSLLIG